MFFMDILKKLVRLLNFLVNSITTKNLSFSKVNTKVYPSSRASSIICVDWLTKIVKTIQSTE